MHGGRWQTSTVLPRVDKTEHSQAVMTPAPYRIIRRRRETPDTWSLRVEPYDRTVPVRFRPGQFSMLYVFGVGEVPISISGDPARNDYLDFTVRSVGMTTAAICNLRNGKTVGVRGPFGSTWPIEESKGEDIVVIAGGLGLAPVRPILFYTLADRSDYGSMSLLYGARNPEDFLYPKALEGWRGRFDMDVHVTVDHADRNWRSNVGVVTRLIPMANFDPEHTSVFVCGPEIMMRFTVDDLLGIGVSEEKIFISLERNMRCGVGLCGHCQMGPEFICKDGPVFPLSRVKRWFGKREV